MPKDFCESSWRFRFRLLILLPSIQQRSTAKLKTMKNTLEELNLSERDFNLLLDGLDNLPHKNAGADLMFELLTMSLMKDDKEGQAKMKAERAELERKQKIEKELLIEDIKILQGKLTMFKRYLQENNLLKEANRIISE